MSDTARVAGGEQRRAAAGWSVYARQCGESHGLTLDGAEAPAPASLGGAFRGLTAQLTPEIFQPEAGNALYVFALPE